MRPPLRFRDDGTFTIAQLTDIHWQNGEPEDLRSQALLERVLDTERPDLVALTGDIVAGRHCQDPCRSWQQVAAPIEARRIPWAAVFGNHDDEGTATRAQMMAAQQACEHCLSQPGPPDVSGVGNYVLPVLPCAGDAPAAALYFLDSGAYSPLGVGDWGWVRRDQIAWYLGRSQELAAGSDSPLPALAFFHIPLPEYNEVWDLHACYGYKHENVCCPAINTGLFAAFVEAGDVMGTFVGHDHVNDFQGELHGIRLCYCRGCGYHTYGGETHTLGARLIRLRQGERSFETWLRLDDGSAVREQPAHPPQGRVLSPRPDAC